MFSICIRVILHGRKVMVKNVRELSFLENFLASLLQKVFRFGQLSTLAKIRSFPYSNQISQLKKVLKKLNGIRLASLTRNRVAGYFTFSRIFLRYCFMALASLWSIISRSSFSSVRICDTWSCV